MKIKILTIGKKNEPEYALAIADFTSRTSHYFDLEWVVLPNSKKTDREQAKKEEAETLLKNIDQGSYVALLDERGKGHTSETFSALIQKQNDNATKKLIFIIGGAYGVAPEILKRADNTISLSGLVFPHQLVRLILIEQIYRAGTILAGQKYHHE